MSKLSINNLDFSNLQAGGGRIILDLIYPVGIIIEFDSNTNPNNIMLGQQWEEFGAGRVLIGVGKAPEDNSITYNLDDKDGSKDAIVVTHTHNIQVYKSNEVGYVPANAWPASVTVRTDVNGINDTGGTWTDRPSGVYSASRTMSDTGSSGTNKNMPPYIAIKRWKRIK